MDDDVVVDDDADVVDDDADVVDVGGGDVIRSVIQ
jgi:hypothetical protein